jgi:outer membrane receptor protein involved in Fe transport
LKPETADTYNAGFQWMSSSDSELFRSMTASVDYYNIDIKNVISVVPGLTTLSKCYNQDGTNPNYSSGNIFCQLIHRDATGQLAEINTPYLNLGGLKTSGVDIEFSWSPSLSSLGLNAAGSVFLTSYLSYVRAFGIQTLPGADFQNFVNTIGSPAPANLHPRWKALTTFGYQNQDFTVALRWHFLGAMDDASSVTSPTKVSPGTPNYSTFDLYSNYWLNDKIQVRAGINNLSDKRSITVSSQTQNTITSIFDPIGRTYYVGLSFSM